MRTLTLKLVAGLVLFFSALPEAKTQDGADLLNKMDKVIFAPKDKQASVRIIVNDDSKKDDKVREAELFQKGPDKKIYRYTFPERQKGIATLSLPGDVMWMYMPALGKPKKISLLARSQAFSGTDFSYEDIPSQPYLERYTPRLIKTETSTFLLELIPLSNRSNYSKLLVSINKTNFYPEKIDYYDKSGNHAKEASYVYSKIEGYWNADQVTMKDMKKGSSTIITMSDVKFDRELDDDLFTEDNFMK